MNPWKLKSLRQHAPLNPSTCQPRTTAAGAQDRLEPKTPTIEHGRSSCRAARVVVLTITLVIFYSYTRLMNTKLASELQKMIDEDQRAVQKRQKKGVVNMRILKVNTKKLKEIVVRNGWPSVSFVGKEGSKNAWLLVQHADEDVSFQKKCLKLMQAEFKKNPENIAPMHIAFLMDRIRVNEKKPQKFGTQFYTNKKGEFTYWPIRDIRNVDKRRAEYGIEKLAEYIKDAKSFHLAPVKKILK